MKLAPTWAHYVVSFAFVCGRSMVPTRATTRHLLGAWFRGFAEACHTACGGVS
jgi:hypothetical protein